MRSWRGLRRRERNDRGNDSGVYGGKCLLDWISSGLGAR